MKSHFLKENDVVLSSVKKLDLTLDVISGSESKRDTALDLLYLITNFD